MLTVKTLHSLRWPSRWKRVANGGGHSYEKVCLCCRRYKIRKSIVVGWATRYYPQYRHPVDGTWELIDRDHAFYSEKTAARACEDFARLHHHYLTVTDDAHAHAR